MRKILPSVIIVLIPLSIAIVFFYLDNTFPRGDECSYFQTSRIIYKASSSFFAFFHQIYFQRHWKAILHPAIGAFFLHLTGGRQMLSLALGSLFPFAIFLIYLLRLMQIFFTEIDSFLVTLWISTTCVTIEYALGFNTEMPFMACSMATLYYLLKSESFKLMKPSILAGIWMGLAGCVRPAEAVEIFSIPVVLLLIRGYKNKIVSRVDLFGTLSLFILAATIISAPPIFHGLDKDAPVQNFAFVLPFTLVPIFLFGLYKKFQIKKKRTAILTPLCLFSCLLYAILIFWFQAFNYSILNWFYRASFSAETLDTGQRYGHPLKEWALHISQTLATPATYVLSAISILMFIALLSLKHFSIRKKIGPLTACMWIVFFPIFLGLISYNGATYYYRIPSLVLHFTIAAVFLTPYLPLISFRRFLIAVLCILQIFYLIEVESGRTYQFVNRLYQYLGAIRNGPLLEPDPSLAFIKELEKGIKSQHARVAIIPLVTSFNDIALDACALEMAAEVRAHDWSFSYPGFASNVKNFYAELPALGYDFFFIGPLSGQPTDPFGPNRTFAKDMFERSLSNHWSNTNLTPLYRLKLLESTSNREDAVLLLSVNKRKKNDSN